MGKEHRRSVNASVRAYVILPLLREFDGILDPPLIMSLVNGRCPLARRGEKTALANTIWNACCRIDVRSPVFTLRINAEAGKAIAEPNSVDFDKLFA